MKLGNQNSLSFNENYRRKHCWSIFKKKLYKSMFSDNHTVTLHWFKIDYSRKFIIANVAGNGMKLWKWIKLLLNTTNYGEKTCSVWSLVCLLEIFCEARTNWHWHFQRHILILQHCWNPFFSSIFVALEM